MDIGIKYVLTDLLCGNTTFTLIKTMIPSEAIRKSITRNKKCSTNAIPVHSSYIKFNQTSKCLNITAKSSFY